VEDAGKTVRGAEDIGGARFAGGVALAPIHLDFLARVAGDGGDFHPHAGGAGGGVPLFDLIGQGHAGGGGKAEVLAVGPSLAEGEVVMVEAHQHREIGFGGTRRQVRPVRGGQQPQRTGMAPRLIRLHGHRINLGAAILGGHGVGLGFGEILDRSGHRTEGGKG